jgi:uncharacterized protein (DUF342 family)
MASEETAQNKAVPQGNGQKTEARIEINDDKTKAVLCLRKGARPLDMKVVTHALKDFNPGGYDAEKLKTEVQAFLQGNDTELDYVLAEGTPSTRGKDRDIQIKVTPLSEEEAKPILGRLSDWYKQDVSFDGKFESQTGMSYAFVEKDELIAVVSEGSDGEKGKDIYGKEIPGLPGNDPDINLSRGLLYRDNSITAFQAGLLIFKGTAQDFTGEVIDYQDAKIGINVSEDAMTAKGTFVRKEGAGIPLSIENVKKVLTTLGIKKGINWEEVERACVEARANGSVLDRVIARGEKPVASGGSFVKWLVDIDPLTASDDGSPGKSTVTVRAGTDIVEISEPLPEGRPGYDIKGNELSVDGGTVTEIAHDAAFREVHTKKGKRFVALRSGELVFDGKTLKISPVKTIREDVTESLNFSGEIRIDGNVRGCRIEGGSHITIDGFAEEASIFAEGKAVVTRGFKGGGKGILKARAGIASAFVERASVMAIGDIRLEKGSILSNIITNERIIVLEQDGRLQGGMYRARHGILAADVGSEKGPVTEVSFGQDYFLKEQIDAAEDEILVTKQNISKTEEKIKEALENKQPIPEDIRIEKIRLVKLLEQLNIKVFNLREKFEEHFDSEIRINGTVYPGVVIESHNRYYEIQEKRSGVIFYFDRESGRIKENPID